MSGRPEKEKENESSGFGLAAVAVVAGASAALGFFANSFWNQKSQEQRASSSSWNPPTTARMESRKKNQDKNKEPVSEDLACVVCYENPKEIMIEPCNHVCLCEDCALKVTLQCPVCNQLITRKKAAYV